MQWLKNTFAFIDNVIDAFWQRLEIKNPRLKKLFRVLFFLLALHIFYDYLGVYSFIHERPCSIHASAQCQRASVARNYYEVSMNFFEPRIQRFRQGDGVMGIEFPVIYYLGAVLYKCFGFNEMYLRAISLLIISAGFLLFYLLSARWFKNNLLALITTGAAIVSPVLLYYSPNFMPDAPSLGLVLCAWHFFFKYRHTAKTSHLVLFVVFGTLAALIKSIAILCFVVALCLLFLDRLKLFKQEQEPYVFKAKPKMILAMAGGMALVFLWYFYAHWLSRVTNNMAFSLQPVLVSDLESLRQVYDAVRKVWLFQYYSYETYVLMACCVILILLFIKRANRLLLAITVLYLLGSLCYVVLFLNQFKNHDYYLIAVLPCVFFLLLTAGDVVMKLNGQYSRLVLPVFVIILFFNLKECFINCRENYFFRYNSKVYLGGEYRPYYDLGPRLKAMGITRKDMFVSAFDDSFTNSLYFMDQPGFTIENCYEHDTIQNSIDVPGVKYLVVSDSAKFNKVYPNHFEKQIVLTHRGLIIYRLK